MGVQGMLLSSNRAVRDQLPVLAYEECDYKCDRMGGSNVTQIGMREFRTHLSAIVRRVRETGETIEITRRGKPVAVLRPLKPWEKELARLDSLTSKRTGEE